MSPLEQAIREAASSGRLFGLTLWPSGSAWRGNAQYGANKGWACTTDADPVAALLGALRGIDAPEEPTAPPAPDLGSVFD